VLRDNPVSARLDGADNVGYLVALRATETAITKAQTTGLAAVGADNTWYTGMLSYYAELITARGLVAMIASNATPWVAVRGSQARFGTNPFCFGFPTRAAAADLGHRHVRNHPCASSFGAAHRRTAARRRGLRRRRRTDRRSRCRAGRVLRRWGGHKGRASGSACSCWALVGSPVLPGQLTDFGFFVLAIDPECFGPADEFTAKVSGYAETLRATRPLDPARRSGCRSSGRPPTAPAAGRRCPRHRAGCDLAVKRSANRRFARQIVESTDDRTERSVVAVHTGALSSGICPIGASRHRCVSRSSTRCAMRSSTFSSGRASDSSSVS
jgi:hypothetical protein